MSKETQFRSFLSVRENQLFIMTALRPPIRLPRHNFWTFQKRSLNLLVNKGTFTENDRNWVSLIMYAKDFARLDCLIDVSYSDKMNLTVRLGKLFYESSTGVPALFPTA